MKTLHFEKVDAMGGDFVERQHLPLPQGFRRNLLWICAAEIAYILGPGIEAFTVELRKHKAEGYSGIYLDHCGGDVWIECVWGPAIPCNTWRMGQQLIRYCRELACQGYRYIHLKNVRTNMNVRREIERCADPEDLPALLWLWSRYHREGQWQLVARRTFTDDPYPHKRLILAPTAEGRALYEAREVAGGDEPAGGD